MMRFATLPQILGALEHSVAYHDFASMLVDRRWGLSTPDSKINQIMIMNRKEGRMDDNVSFRNINQPCLDEGIIKPYPSFYVVRDDLLHPLVNGNKARKLDAVLPILEDNAVTDVVTCGGCQSAHTAAVAVSCSQRGLKSHLLLRGEEPETLTGYNLVSSLYGNVVYVPRSVYANREEMLLSHAESVAGSRGSVIRLDDMMESSSKNYEVEHINIPGESRKVVIINEGAGNAVALLGVMRLIQYMSRNDVFGNKQALKIIVDAGTGTTAVGLGLGALCLGLPWEVTAVMLADKINGYKAKEQILVSEFFKMSQSSPAGLNLSHQHPGIVQWVERRVPRKFGNILTGEVEECKKIAQQTGILVDPIYTLAAWDAASQMSKTTGKDTKVVMLHTGGTLGMFGLAQRYKSHFQIK